MARPALALLAQVSPLSGFLISSAPGAACFLAQPPPARNWIPERGSDGKGAPGRGCEAVLAAPGGGRAVRSHPRLAQPSPAQPAPGVGSEPIKSWNDPPPWLLPKAASRPFLLLSPLLGMLFIQYHLQTDALQFTYESERQLHLGRKSYDQPRQHIKKQRHYLPTKVRLVKAKVFPVIMYGSESWTIKKAEHQRIDAFELRCWRRLLRVPWTVRRSIQSILKERSILKEINPEYSLERLMLKLQLQYLAT